MNLAKLAKAALRFSCDRCRVTTWKRASKVTRRRDVPRCCRARMRVVGVDRE